MSAAAAPSPVNRTAAGAVRAMGALGALGALGAVMRMLQYAGLYVQLHAALHGAQGEPENRVSGNALFTEAPRDVTTRSGEDVEMACSFRGAGAPSHLLEIQWWYMKDHRDRQEKADPIATNNVEALEETSEDATKISVVKVAGSNISHKLRLSSVTPADEGTYECRVIDFSGGGATERRRHRVRARLQVAPERSFTPQGSRQTEGRDLKRRPAGAGEPVCTGSCGL